MHSESGTASLQSSRYAFGSGWSHQSLLHCLPLATGDSQSTQSPIDQARGCCNSPIACTEACLSNGLGGALVRTYAPLSSTICQEFPCYSDLPCPGKLTSQLQCQLRYQSNSQEHPKAIPKAKAQHHEHACGNRTVRGSNCMCVVKSAYVQGGTHVHSQSYGRVYKTNRTDRCRYGKTTHTQTHTHTHTPLKQSSAQLEPAPTINRKPGNMKQFVTSCRDKPS